MKINVRLILAVLLFGVIWAVVAHPPQRIDSNLVATAK